MTVKCSVDEFTCQTNNQCIPAYAVCDGVQVNILNNKINFKIGCFSFSIGLC